jgi:hypothetical protein
VLLDSIHARDGFLDFVFANVKVMALAKHGVDAEAMALTARDRELINRIRSSVASME